MKYIRFLILAWFFFIFTAQIGVPKYEHDFGKVKADQIATCTFEIENNENEPLIVEYIEGG
ncbi:MAG: DUF1573 domain-containing protein [Proteobacteria bacterium]|nr:DUF1573 domain-containing protein [Pseudomonadota bacterium]